MPTILTVNGFRFYFYSNENDEPIHIHVEKADGNAKYWLEPVLEEEYSYGFKAKQRKEIEAIIAENINDLITAWNEYFN
ncbi:MAG: DUF4160 domain-containing protein [Flavobacteriales bacterium]